jgi:hypothetical protein
MLTFPYNTNEVPAVPYITLQIQPAQQPGVPVIYEAKLDSGAGLTVIPIDLAQRWGLRRDGAIRLQAYNGHISTNPIYWVDIVIGAWTFPMVQVTALRRANVLLERNVLNQMRIIHDGPQQAVTITSRS